MEKVNKDVFKECPLQVGEQAPNPVVFSTKQEKEVPLLSLASKEVVVLNFGSLS